MDNYPMRSSIIKMLSSLPPCVKYRDGVEDKLRGIDFYLYGAGSGYSTFNTFILQKYGLRPKGIIDRKFTEAGEFSGLPTHTPNSFTLPPEERQVVNLVITLGNPEEQEKISEQFSSTGFRKIIRANEVFEYHLSHAKTKFDIVGLEYWESHKENILQVFDLLEDVESQQVFCALLKVYVEKVLAPIPGHPLKDQYLPSDLYVDYSRTINCGSYDGDTVRAMVQRKGSFDALACFEPDPENFSKLSKYLSSDDSIAKLLSAYPCGVYSQTSQQRFRESEKVNSSMNLSGENIIQCVAIDDVLPNFAPTLINMDVEGVEPEALQGAAKTIRKYTPSLAISVYHEPAHLWEIPLAVHDLHSDYKIYLRNYTSFPAETVMYAIS